VSSEELRAHLLRSLPEYMVPAGFTSVAVIPLNASGKVDRRVPAPVEVKIGSGREYAKPRNSTERQLAEIWSELLQVQQISVYDDFFKLGGHSLLAVRLKSMLLNRLGWELPLTDLFRAPTVAGLAQLMEAAQQAPAVNNPLSSVLVEIQPGAATPVFFVHPVEGIVLCYLELARELGLKQPFYAFQSPDAGISPEQVGSLEQMAHLYIRMMRRVQPTGPYLLGGWSLGGLLAWEMARQLMDEGQEIGLLALLDTHPPNGTELVRGTNGALPLFPEFAQDMARSLGENIDLQSEDFQRLSAEQQRIFVQDMLMRHGVVSRTRAEQESADILEVFTRNLQAMVTYRMRRTEQRILLFAAAEGEAREHLVEHWKSWTPAIDFYVVPGTHYTMVRQPNIAVIAEILRRAISDSKETSSFAAAGQM